MTQEPELVAPLADNYSSMVLLIDDQVMVCEAVRRALANEPDIALHFCTDPLKAMAVADEVKPTVILQDLVMPGVDGLHLVKEYRKHSSTHAVPVIVLSSKEDPATKGEAFAAGANDYLVKLPDRIELIARIRYHTRAYLDHVQRDAAYRALRESQRQLISANLELERLTRIDGLTGLGNRRYFDEYLAAEWKRAFRVQSPLSLLMIDADNFKRYNDSYGHMAGDEVLKKIARVIESSSGRSTDLAARYGGEEFVIVLVDTPLEQSSSIAERLVQSVRDLNIPHGAGRVTISVGVASTVPNENETPSDFVNAADLALFRSKSEGRDRVALHVPRN
ncbi:MULTISPECIES: PleD family two-component system response regulator [unclassified Mesorhizobium]|uniref:response regulator n=1 Tax=unclassified Mesorhizobium TaxID=325217 RepID=UPI000BAE7A98|nr:MULTISPECIES: PleD family two-component system response regulator [unclassified Mesorhizobium]PBB16538.1 diguanylate cyclase response regulator [Mesorhizobium sp. WSM4313]TPI72561.1 PleD family two-component system response regulator [Mesorhizobium sp. B2-8-9]